MKGRGPRRRRKPIEEEERGGAKGRKCQGERISGKPRRGEGIAKGGGGDRGEVETAKGRMTNEEGKREGREERGRE